VMLEPGKYDGLPPSDQGHILENFKYTLDGMPLLGFDPSSWAQQLMNSAANSHAQWARGKPVFATVRGHGGGKTKAFTEIRKELIKNENNLV